MKTHAEFLEELKQSLRWKAYYYQRDFGKLTSNEAKWITQGKCRACEKIVAEIEQFEAQLRDE